MPDPSSTYRIQLHKQFTLTDLERLIPYLHKLGIRTIYASPLFRAVPGSCHGYDSVDPSQINPELGTEEQLLSISRQLHEKNMCWLQDLVPNHMAIHCDNLWLMDVLDKGKASPYADYFDINWEAEPDGKLAIPVLATDAEAAIDKGELTLTGAQEQLWLSVHEKRYPVNNTLFEQSCKAYFSEVANVEHAATDKDFLKQLIRNLPYKLVPSGRADQQMSYRRFFTINELMGLNIQDANVYKDFHRYLFELLQKQIFQGLRIDHIDGLYKPSEYLEQLRADVGDEIYIVVEKILGLQETLPAWPVQGTTGYDFLALVNQLLTSGGAESAFTQFYDQLTVQHQPIAELAREKKMLILVSYMGGELSQVSLLLAHLSGLSLQNARDLLIQFMVRYPVYRYYSKMIPLSGYEKQAIGSIISVVGSLHPHLAQAADSLKKILLEELPEQDRKEKAERFYRRCMQLAAPLMAKGVEDTLLYTFNRFIAHNEVGDTPACFGITPDEFHAAMLARQRNWPLSMNATSTHDTKRGEDVRARLNVLSDVPALWLETVAHWQALNAPLKEDNIPDANEEYLIYQTILGTYPMPGSSTQGFKERLLACVPKMLREAKVHSHWEEPDENYEKAVKDFISRLLDKQSPFFRSFNAFHKKIADPGIINSLTQLTLKCTCPGVPDFYQGTELWDLSLVDPDNRRPVDYEQRKNDLRDLLFEEDTSMWQKLWQQRSDGRIKMQLMNLLLQQRCKFSQLFEKGNYVPLVTGGKYEQHLFAFARRFRQQWMVCIVPLHLAQLPPAGTIAGLNWKDTRVHLPAEAPTAWREIITGKTGTSSGNSITVSDIFETLPIAVLELEWPHNKRGAGLLMPITSLPSAFGIGDLGPAAKEFADILSRSGQKYWQLLPLTPIHARSGYSPYSSASSMAGNYLLISPESLAAEGLLTDADLEVHRGFATGRINYNEAEATKQALLNLAFSRFMETGTLSLKKEFDNFCTQEAWWLDDYVCYEVIRDQQDAPWYQWPAQYRNRDPHALQQVRLTNQRQILYLQWKQFVFHKQWRELKAHCHMLGISLFGDLPFYVSHDSVDVWADPEIFSLDEHGEISGIAGIPPDYFSASGQLWNMPTFRWDVIKRRDYSWWISRMRKNSSLYDLLRIDHFRALAEYWEVPAGAKTAVNGKWLAGPGKHFFDVMEKELGHLTLVAEDLGEASTMQKPYQLRDAVGLPGMKVLQFAFGEDQATSVDSPHNYSTNCVAYTGTHDNNTTLGWYRHETDAASRRHITQYAGKKTDEKNIVPVMIEMAYASVAAVVIVPVQDVLSLDESARLNSPGKESGNWLWQLKEGELTGAVEKWLLDLTKRYNRM